MEEKILRRVKNFGHHRASIQIQQRIPSQDLNLRHAPSARDSPIVIVIITTTTTTTTIASCSAESSRSTREKVVAVHDPRSQPTSPFPPSITAGPHVSLH
ncbi:hypothetical protein NL676_027455 [Syzygium grande]|nr:hypothetical protein NL676_027455 [Syzygium grande]